MARPRFVYTPGGPYELTVAQTGAKLGITGAGVSSIERRFARTLRRVLGAAQEAGEIDLQDDHAGRNFFQALSAAFTDSGNRKGALRIEPLPIR